MERPVANESSFEEVVRALCFPPEQYADSVELKAWFERNKDVEYVSQEMLRVFGPSVQV